MSSVSFGHKSDSQLQITFLPLSSLTFHIIYPYIAEKCRFTNFRVEAETGPCTQSKERNGETMKMQENLLTRFILGVCRMKSGHSALPESKLCLVYICLTGCSHIFKSDDLNYTLPSQAASLEQLLVWKWGRLNKHSKEGGSDKPSLPGSSSNGSG